MCKIVLINTLALKYSVKIILGLKEGYFSFNNNTNCHDITPNIKLTRELWIEDYYHKVIRC